MEGIGRAESWTVSVMSRVGATMMGWREGRKGDYYEGIGSGEGL